MFLESCPCACCQTVVNRPSRKRTTHRTNVCPETGYRGLAGYKFGCRCDVCREAKAEERRKYRPGPVRKASIEREKQEALARRKSREREILQRRIDAKAAQLQARKDADEKRLAESWMTFLVTSNSVHQFSYDYSKVKWLGLRSQIEIVCPKHGIFEHRADRHMKGQKCPQCVQAAILDKRKQKWLTRASKLHKHFYDYSKVVFTNTKTPVTITCPVHGDFEQTPEVHIKRVKRGHYVSRGCGCPKCKRSFGENLMADLLEASGIDFEEQWSHPDCKGETGWKLRFDFYLPDYNAVIEVDGMQHSKPVFGKTDRQKLTTLKQTQHRDSIKEAFLISEGIQLLRVSSGDLTDSLRAILSLINPASAV